MSEEERMDRKGNSHYSVQKSNGADSKKDVSSKKWSNRRGNSSGGGNFSYSEGQNRKPTPQKYRNTWDRRPRQRGEFPSGNGGDLEEEEAGAEYGSAIQAGSKKGNLNHLLNFKYEHEVPEHGGGYRGGAAGHYSRGRQVRYKNSRSRGSKVCYNKEQFLQANCQFVVKDTGDYTVQMMDPDQLVNWDAVEQVRVLSNEPPSCPICLHFPIAAKMTRCGHIFCWACILHYLALGEKTWRKCPICYEAIHNDDLKSASCREVSTYKVGDEVTLTLMKKEKGSIYAVPANLWQKQAIKCHNIQESHEMTRHCKLLIASPEQVLDLVDIEKHQLHMQLVDAEASEEPFIKGAQDQLKARQLSLLGVNDIQKAVEQAVESTKQEMNDVPPVKTSPPTNKNTNMKQYKSAWSDEEEEMDVQSKPEEDTGDSQSQTGDSSEHHSGDSAAESESSTEQNTSSPDIAMAQPILEDGTIQSGSPENAPSPIEMIPDIMPVEEAAEHLELPVHERNRHKSGENAFYFYQADDGQHIYLHSMNARCLVRDYGSLEHCPQKITATIIDKESVFVTDELRKRLRYLSHLPLTCGFEVVELALKPPVVTKDTLKHFHDEIEKRRRYRQRRAREDKQRARYIEEQERKKLGIGTGTIVHSQFNQSVSHERVSESRSDTSSPLLDTPIGSPNTLKIDEAHSGTSLDDGQTATVSFAQMLKAGAKSTVWPKMKGDQDKSPGASSSSMTRHVGSDESDNEDKVPVPEFQRSFGSALEAAFGTIGARKEPDASSTPGTSNTSTGANGGAQQQTSGKKKKKQLVLFSTSMARGGK